MAGIRQELFALLRSIVDEEWGPYEDGHYWKMVNDFMARVTPQGQYYSASSFLEAWWRGVQLAGPQYFGDGQPLAEMPSSKDALEPRYRDIMANLGILSSGEAAFLVSLYSFYNSHAAEEMWELANAWPMASLASCLDEPRRRVISDLLVSYQGW